MLFSFLKKQNVPTADNASAILKKYVPFYTEGSTAHAQIDLSNWKKRIFFSFAINRQNEDVVLPPQKISIVCVAE